MEVYHTGRNLKAVFQERTNRRALVCFVPIPGPTRRWEEDQAETALKLNDGDWMRAREHLYASSPRRKAASKAVSAGVPDPIARRVRPSLNSCRWSDGAFIMVGACVVFFGGRRRDGPVGEGESRPRVSENGIATGERD